MLTGPPGDRKTASEVGSTDTIRLKQAMAICEAYMGGQSSPVVMSVTGVHTMLRSNQDIAKSAIHGSKMYDSMCRISLLMIASTCGHPSVCHLTLIRIDRPDVEAFCAVTRTTI